MVEVTLEALGRAAVDLAVDAVVIGSLLTEVGSR
jgi:hypothetical protein